MSIIPGIEIAAPERTETSSGLDGSPKLVPVACSSRLMCSVDLVLEAGGQLAAGGHVGAAGVGRDREAGGDRNAEVRHLRRARRPCRRADRGRRGSARRTSRRSFVSVCSCRVAVFIADAPLAGVTLTRCLDRGDRTSANPREPVAVFPRGGCRLGASASAAFGPGREARRGVGNSCRLGACGSRRSQELLDLVVVDRRKVRVEQTHRAEVIDHVWAHDIADFAPQDADCLAGSHGGRSDDAVRSLAVHPTGRRDHRCACRQAVVDEHDRPILEGRLRTTATERPVEPVRFGARQVDREPELSRRQAVTTANVSGRTGRDGADGVLQIARVSDLSHCHEVQRKTERARDRGTDHDAAARQPDNNRAKARFSLQRAGEHLASSRRSAKRSDEPSCRLAVVIGSGVSDDQRRALRAVGDAFGNRAEGTEPVQPSTAEHEQVCVERCSCQSRHGLGRDHVEFVADDL